MIAAWDNVFLIFMLTVTVPGEASRPFQRTRYFDSTLAALVRLGVRLLWSDGAEESAGLLADVARLEHRKGHGIGIPVEVKGQHRQQALQLYLSLPSVNYVQALNMSHNFTSIAQLINRWWTLCCIKLWILSSSSVRHLFFTCFLPAAR